MTTTAEHPGAIDLFRIRCAVAALVVCVDHGGLLTVAGVRRTDLAVRILSHVDLPAGSALGAAIGRLLSPADDPGGVRTIGAIDDLSALTHVDIDSAPALAAALLSTLPPPHQGDLFDPDPDEPPPGHSPPVSLPRPVSLCGPAEPA